MKPYLVDVPVFMIFFNRPEPLKKVFEAVREARPSKLFLACDGPRPNRPEDAENIQKCKEIVECIDWECEVFRDYSEINLGCGMRMYSGLKWTFEHVDRAIILEDDCVPHNDFFVFCMELLEKYKEDNRISLISGMNHLEVYEETPYDYFFGGGCCWGWATWKRFWDIVDFDMSFLEDEYSMRCVEKIRPDSIKIGAERKKIIENGGRLSAWTYQSGVSSLLNSQICIMPTKNLITNIGITADSGHAVDDVRKLCRKTRKLFNLPMHGYEFPLKHPPYVIFDNLYKERVDKKYKLNLFDRVEGTIRFIIFSNFKEVANKIRKKLFK